ncbi:MAG: hypothetical protein KKB20_10735 [Proteobacteria bacterium]|nr:hypothetical protein [Pseudomonadota bacterium]
MKENIGEISTKEFVQVMVTNTLSPRRLLEQLTENVRQGGVVGVMSPGQGSITDNENGSNDVYRISKAALNMIIRSFVVRKGKYRAPADARRWPNRGIQKGYIQIRLKRSYKLWQHSTSMNSTVRCAKLNEKQSNN